MEPRDVARSSDLPRLSFGRRLAIVSGLKVYVIALIAIAVARSHVQSGYAGPVYTASEQTRAERLADVRGFDRLAPYGGQYYLHLALSGYYPSAGEGGSVQRPKLARAYFPLFPFVLRILAAVGLDPVAAGVVLNVVLSTLALAVLWSLADTIGSRGSTCVLLMLSFPTSLFQFFLYTESLFFCLTVSLTFCVRNQRPIAAATLGYLCALCRPQGVLTCLLCLGFLNSWRKNALTHRLWAILALAAPALGLATVALIHWLGSGDPLRFVEVQREFGRPFALSPLFNLAAYRGPEFDVFSLFLSLGLLPFVWRTLPAPLALYATASVAMPLLTGTVLSLGRFISVCFPLFLCLSTLLNSRRVLFVAIVIASVVFQVAVIKAAVAWYFVG